MEKPAERDELTELLEAAETAPSRKKRLLWGGAGLLLLLIAASLLLWRGEEGQRYETRQVRRGDLEVTVTATGTVEGVNTVEVGAEVSGRLVEVLADFNSRVEAGQLLARIDPENFEAAVEQASARVVAAQASLEEARATRAEARSNLQRAEAQAAEGLIARQELDQIRAAAARAGAQVASAEAQLRLERASLSSAKTELARTEIRSPIDGLVLSRLVEPGQTVTAGFETPVLFKVTADLSRMRVDAEVDESDVGRVRAGQPARFSVDAWPDRTFEAQVEAVYNEPIADESVVAYETRLSFDNSEGLLRPGMTATVTIITDRREEALLVPNAALRFQPPMPGGGRGPPMMRGARPRGGQPRQPGGPTVWLEGAEGPRPLQVKVKASDGRDSEVEAQGLEPGDPVIVGLAERTDG